MSVPERRENIKCIGDRGHRVAIPEHFGRFSKLHSQQSKTRRWGWFHLAINAYVRASQRTKTDHFGSICSPVTPPSLCGTESALGSWLKMSALQKHSKRCFKVRKDGSHASELNFWKGLFQTCSLCRENRRDLSPSGAANRAIRPSARQGCDPRAARCSQVEVSVGSADRSRAGSDKLAVLSSAQVCN